MRLTRYRPGFPESAWAQPVFGDNRIHKMLAELMGPQMAEGMGWCPEVDVLENDEEVILRADLPGLSTDDVELEVRDNNLIMKGEKKEEKEEKGSHYRMVERSYGAFERSFALPTTVDAEQIRAGFENGVLEVHLPKTAKAQGRKVPIAGKA